MASNDGYTIQEHPTLPILMTHFDRDFIFTEHSEEYTADVKGRLNSLDHPVYYLFDLTHWRILSFGEMMEVAAQAAHGKDSNFHHPMNRQTLVVTQDEMVLKSAEGMKTAAYGNPDLEIFHTVDEALNYVKSHA